MYQLYIASMPILTNVFLKFLKSSNIQLLCHAHNIVKKLCHSDHITKLLSHCSAQHRCLNDTNVLLRDGRRYGKVTPDLYLHRFTFAPLFSKAFKRDIGGDRCAAQQSLNIISMRVLGSRQINWQLMLCSTEAVHKSVWICKWIRLVGVYLCITQMFFCECISWACSAICTVVCLPPFQTTLAFLSTTPIPILWDDIVYIKVTYMT